MSFTTYDFSESLDRVGIRRKDIEEVYFGYGDDNDGWSGGFGFKLKDGRYAHLTGWCDYTGRGCQDGADVTYFETVDGLNDDFVGETRPELERDPADLNIYIREKNDE